MRLLIAIMPTVFLVVFSQILTKWRVSSVYKTSILTNEETTSRLVMYLKDPYIVSAYLASFTASIVWILVIEKHSISTAFPLYIGLTVLLVMLGGAVLLKEPFTVTKVLAAVFIIIGVAIGAK